MFRQFNIVILDAGEAACRSEDFSGMSRLHIQTRLLGPCSDDLAAGPNHLFQLSPKSLSLVPLTIGLVVMDGDKSRVALQPTDDGRALYEALDHMSTSARPRGGSGGGGNFNRSASNLSAALKLSLLLARNQPCPKIYAYVAGPLAFTDNDAVDLRQRLRERLETQKQKLSVRIALLVTREEAGLEACDALESALSDFGGSKALSFITAPKVSSSSSEEEIITAQMELALALGPAVCPAVFVNPRAGGTADVEEMAPTPVAPQENLRRRLPLRATCRESTLDRYLVRSSTGLLRPTMPSYSALHQRLITGSALNGGRAIKIRVMPRYRTISKIDAGRVLIEDISVHSDSIHTSSQAMHGSAAPTQRLVPLPGRGSLRLLQSIQTATNFVLVWSSSSASRDSRVILLASSTSSTTGTTVSELSQDDVQFDMFSGKASVAANILDGWRSKPLAHNGTEYWLDLPTNAGNMQDVHVLKPRTQLVVAKHPSTGNGGGALAPVIVFKPAETNSAADSFRNEGVALAFWVQRRGSIEDSVGAINSSGRTPSNESPKVQQEQHGPVACAHKPPHWALLALATMLAIVSLTICLCLRLLKVILGGSRTSSTSTKRTTSDPSTTKHENLAPPTPATMDHEDILCMKRALETPPLTDIESLKSDISSGALATPSYTIPPGPLATEVLAGRVHLQIGGSPSTMPQGRHGPSGEILQRGNAGGGSAGRSMPSFTQGSSSSGGGEFEGGTMLGGSHTGTSRRRIVVQDGPSKIQSNNRVIIRSNYQKIGIHQKPCDVDTDGPKNSPSLRKSSKTRAPTTATPSFQEEGSSETLALATGSAASAPCGAECSAEVPPEGGSVSPGCSEGSQTVPIAVAAGLSGQNSQPPASSE